MNSDEVRFLDKIKGSKDEEFKEYVADKIVNRLRDKSGRSKLKTGLGFTKPKKSKSDFLNVMLESEEKTTDKYKIRDSFINICRELERCDSGAKKKIMYHDTKGQKTTLSREPCDCGLFMMSTNYLSETDFQKNNYALRLAK